MTKIDEQIDEASRKSKISGDLREPLGSRWGPPRASRGLRKPPKPSENLRKPPKTSEARRCSIFRRKSPFRFVSRIFLGGERPPAAPLGLSAPREGRAVPCGAGRRAGAPEGSAARRDARSRALQGRPVPAAATAAPTFPGVFGGLRRSPGAFGGLRRPPEAVGGPRRLPRGQRLRDSQTPRGGFREASQA